jgi:hypothetical protein
MSGFDWRNLAQMGATAAGTALGGPAGGMAANTATSAAMSPDSNDKALPSGALTTDTGASEHDSPFMTALASSAGSGIANMGSSIGGSLLNNSILGSPGERARKYMQQAYPGMTTAQLLGAQGGGMAGTPGSMDAAREAAREAAAGRKNQMSIARQNFKTQKDNARLGGQVQVITSLLDNMDQGTLGSKYNPYALSNSKALTGMINELFGNAEIPAKRQWGKQENFWRKDPGPRNRAPYRFKTGKNILKRASRQGVQEYW